MNPLVQEKTTLVATCHIATDHVMNPSLTKIDTFDTRILGDQNSSFPIDVAVVDVDDVVIIVVCDRANCLKSIHREKGEIHKQKLEDVRCPVSVTTLEGNRLAVTIPHARQIVIIEATPHLQLVSTIKTETSYLGITALTSSTLAVSSLDPPGVDIVDHSGSVLKSLEIDQGVLKDPSCLATTPVGNIMVSDSEARLVLCMNPIGETVFRFTHTDTFALNTPLGLAVLQSGDVLLVDYGLHCIIQLTDSGQIVKKLLTSADGISNPHSVCVDRQGRLYVCDWFEEEVSVYSKGKADFERIR